MDVVEFVRPFLANPDLPFQLHDSRGAPVPPDEGQSLAALGLSPAALLHFTWDADVAAAGLSTFLSEDARASAGLL